MKYKFLYILTIIFLSSCTFVGKERDVKLISKKQAVDFNKSFYLIYPKNGEYQTFFFKNSKENISSAKEVTRVFKKKYTKRFKQIDFSNTNISLDEGFISAFNNNSYYLIDIKINEWKDAFALMCKPVINGNGDITGKTATKDSSDITISIYDVNSKELINQQRLVGNGCPVLFFGLIPVGSNSPGSYLKYSLKKWEKNL